jgi:hypothetical protein
MHKISHGWPWRSGCNLHTANWFYVPLKNFSLMETSALLVKVCKIWVYAWRSGSLSREVSLSCHTCCDTGSWFSSLIQRTVPSSRLLRHTKGCWGSTLTRILTGLIQQMVKAVESGVKGIDVACEDTDVYVLHMHFYAKLNQSCCFTMEGPSV